MLQKQHEATERGEIHWLLHIAVTGICAQVHVNMNTSEMLIFIRHGNDFKYCLLKGKTLNICMYAKVLDLCMYD